MLWYLHTLFSWLTLINSFNLEILFRLYDDGACLITILYGLRLLGFVSMYSIFFKSTLFSFCISMYLVISYLVFAFVPFCKCWYYLGAFVSSMLFMLLKRDICSSCSYKYGKDHELWLDVLPSSSLYHKLVCLQLVILYSYLFVF